MKRFLIGLVLLLIFSIIIPSSVLANPVLEELEQVWTGISGTTPTGSWRQYKYFVVHSTTLSGGYGDGRVRISFHQRDNSDNQIIGTLTQPELLRKAQAIGSIPQMRLLLSCALSGDTSINLADGSAWNTAFMDETMEIRIDDSDPDYIEYQITDLKRGEIGTPTILRQVPKDENYSYHLLNTISITNGGTVTIFSTSDGNVPQEDDPLPDSIENIEISPQSPRNAQNIGDIPSTFEYGVKNWPEAEGVLWWRKEYQLYVTINNSMPKRVTKPLSGVIDGQLWHISYHTENISWLPGVIQNGENKIAWHVKREDWPELYKIKEITFNLDTYQWEYEGNTFEYTGEIKNQARVTLNQAQAAYFTYVQTGYEGIRMTVNNIPVNPDMGDNETGSFRAYNEWEYGINFVRFWYLGTGGIWIPMPDASITFYIVTQEELDREGGYWNPYTDEWVEYGEIPSPEEGLLGWIRYIGQAISNTLREITTFGSEIMKAAGGLINLWMMFFAWLPTPIISIIVVGISCAVILRVLGR